MEKIAACITCSHRDERGMCECWQMHTYDSEHCLYYSSKPTFMDELAKWCVIGLLLLVALCSAFALSGCADAKVGTYREPDNYMEHSRFINHVNDSSDTETTETCDTEAEGEVKVVE